MRPSRSLAAGAERAPIRIHNAKSQFERGLTFSRHALEFRDEVSPEGELRALDAGSETREAPAARDALAIEGRRDLQGRVVADLRPEGYRLGPRWSLRNLWRDVEAAGDLEIGGGRGGEDRRVEQLFRDMLQRPWKRRDPASKRQCLGLFNARQRLDFGEHLFRDRAVHLDERDRGAALAVAAERECRDIDRGIAEKARETADETRLVFIADVNHHGRDQRVDFDPIDRNDARLSIVKNSAGDRALAVLRCDRQRDERLVISVGGAG